MSSEGHYPTCLNCLSLRYDLNPRTRYGLLRDLLGKALLELEEAPCLGQRLVTPIQSDQKQFLENLRRNGTEPWATATTVWLLPLTTILSQTLRVLLKIREATTDSATERVMCLASLVT